MRLFVTLFNIKYLMSVNYLFLRICDAEMVFRNLLEFNNFSNPLLLYQSRIIAMCIIVILAEKL